MRFDAQEGRGAAATRARGGGPPAIAVSNVNKSFAGVPALKDVDLHLDPGEVVGLVGENGAGKSTLIRIMSGAYHPDSGRIDVGEESNLSFSSPLAAQKIGIATVHQHSMLAENLTVAENLVLGREPGVKLVPWWIGRRKLRARAQEIADEVDIDAPLKRVAGSLSLAQRQLVEILRASAEAGKLMILDEPTAALNQAEVDELFRLIRKLTRRGLPVLYVSHRLDEISKICDRVVVLRDGEKVAELGGAEATPEAIIPRMIGGVLGELFPEHSKPGDVLLKVVDLGNDRITPITLTVREGEVLGLTGPLGAGQRDLARMIFGVEPTKGSISVRNKSFQTMTPSRAVGAGIAYISGDRANEGLIPALSVWRNLTLVKMRVLGFLGFLSPRGQRKLGVEKCEEFNVRASSPDQAIDTLSGGNQQKVIVARWAITKPKVLILDEPTLGVDIGSRKELYQQIHNLCEEGTAVLLVSSDYAEIRGLSHRVLVFADGRVVAEMAADDATEEAVLHAAVVRDDTNEQTVTGGRE